MTSTISTARLVRWAREYRRWVREQCDADGYIPICVKDGRKAPSIVGRCGHYTTKTGRPVYHPNAYRKAWGKPVYHASTIAVEVGRAWLNQRHVPEWAMVHNGVDSWIFGGLCGDAGVSAMALDMPAVRIFAEIGVRGAV